MELDLWLWLWTGKKRLIAFLFASRQLMRQLMKWIAHSSRHSSIAPISHLLSLSLSILPQIQTDISLTCVGNVSSAGLSLWLAPVVTPRLPCRLITDPCFEPVINWDLSWLHLSPVTLRATRHVPWSLSVMYQSCWFTCEPWDGRVAGVDSLTYWSVGWVLRIPDTEGNHSCVTLFSVVVATAPDYDHLDAWVVTYSARHWLNEI